MREEPEPSKHCLRKNRSNIDRTRPQYFIRSHSRFFSNMSEYKNQHYVPQFYLRAFSFDGGRNIALFNISRNKVIPAGNIASQCSEDYFYGRDPQAEKALSASVEAPASRVMSHLIKSATLPPPYTEERAALFVFALFQHGRTLHASKEGWEFFQAFVEPNLKRLALQSGGLTPDDVKGMSIELERPANLTLATSAQMLPLILDLNVKLLINQTPQDFITSDHPVAKTNQYFLGNLDGGVTGWGAKGLQVFVPLSPRHAIMFYDEKIYKVGARKSDVVFIAQGSDVDALNTLQLLNAHGNIYFRDPKQGSHISRLFASCRHRRKEDKVATRFFDGTDSTGALINGQHTYKLNLAFSEVLSFCKVQTAKKQIPPESREYGLRQPGLVAAHKQFLKEVDAGKYKADEWSKFLDENTTAPGGTADRARGKENRG